MKFKEYGINIVILTAGKGSRMNSNLPKILHKIAGISLFEHVLLTIEKIQVEEKNIIVITSNEILKNFSNMLPQSDHVKYVVQKDRKGTGHAVSCAIKSKFWNHKNCLTGIFYGDVPFITIKTIENIMRLQNKFDLVVLGFDCADQTRAYGRLFTNKDLKTGDYGVLYQIKEFKDLMREKPRLCNSGVIIGKTEIFETLLPRIKTNNNAKEYYLTDIIELANGAGYKIGTYICDEREVIGINSRAELAHAEKVFQDTASKQHLLNGATLVSRDNVHFSYDTKIGKDVIIEPNVFFGTGVKIGDNCIIRAGCYLENTEIMSDSDIGPNARTRGEKTIINSNVHVGNLVEIKNSIIGAGTKIGHFSYIGDANIGKNVNFGAGAVICNYDGREKHNTIIGDDCFIGSNSSIISPCEIEHNAYIAAGSVITENVQSNSLAIARARQTNINDWVINIDEKRKNKKKCDKKK